MAVLDNDIHELFAHEYLQDLNATKAYMRVRPETTYDSARNYGNKLLQDIAIRARVRELMDERSKDTLVDSTYVVQNLNKVYQQCVNEAKPILKFNHETGEMEETGEYQFDSNGANKALELLGKHVAMFTDKSVTEVNPPTDPAILAALIEKINANASPGKG